MEQRTPVCPHCGAVGSVAQVERVATVVETVDQEYDVILSDDVAYSDLDYECRNCWGVVGLDGVIRATFGGKDDG